MSKVALITGICGQDGSYLAQWLLSLGYEVHGTTQNKHVSRKSFSTVHPPVGSLWTTDNQLLEIVDRVQFHQLDYDNEQQIESLIREIHPHEIYNLTSQSSVGISWQQPLETGQANALLVIRLLEAIRKFDTAIRFYQASSSEMFGRPVESPQRETTRFNPCSPYAAAKAYAHWVTVNYREAYDMFACCGILFNHESPRRSLNFVTRKITHAVASIVAERSSSLHLGNLHVARDWGFAGDYVQAMQRMLQLNEPQDLVIGTGKVYQLLDFVANAFAYVGLDWQRHVLVDPKLARPLDLTHCQADASLAYSLLDWRPAMSFSQLIAHMVDHDIAELKRNAELGMKPRIQRVA